MPRGPLSCNGEAFSLIGMGEQEEEKEKWWRSDREVAGIAIGGEDKRKSTRGDFRAGLDGSEFESMMYVCKVVP